MDEIPNDWKESLDTYKYLEELILTVADRSYEMGLKRWTERGNTATHISLIYAEVRHLMETLVDSTTPRYKDEDNETES